MTRFVLRLIFTDFEPRIIACRRNPYEFYIILPIIFVVSKSEFNTKIVIFCLYFSDSYACTHTFIHAHIRFRMYPYIYHTYTSCSTVWRTFSDNPQFLILTSQFVNLHLLTNLHYLHYLRRF